MSGTVVDALSWWARSTPDFVAIDFDGDRVTYAQLDTWADGVAAGLAADGVQAGDRVSIAGVNSLEWCVAALAGFKVGAIVAPFNNRMVARELADLIEDCEPAVVFADEGAIEERVREVQDAGAKFRLKTLQGDVRPLRGGAHAAIPNRAVDPRDPTAIVYTSGTTGKPKGVIFTHATIAGEMHEWHLIEPIRPQGLRTLLVLPLFTAAGIIWGISRVTLHGGTLFLQPRFVPDRALEVMAAHKVTTLTGPPILFEQISRVDGFDEADLSSLTTAHCGGARVPADLLKAWLKKGVALRQIYGQTEIGGSATVTPRAEAHLHPEKCGFGGIFTKIRVVDSAGNDLPPNEQGEILLRGPGMMPGYWRNEEATRSAIVAGWLHTGDIGKLDERGYLTYVDRAKDMIISGGLNIAPLEIEQVIQALPGVREVAVISVPDAKFGETPAALIGAEAPLDAADVIAWCDERLADYKVPRYVVFVDGDLPRMASGKIAKRALRQEYAAIPQTTAKVR
ncbi:class I adenylate-forming enzyme family protein [Actinomadura rugatobispora]|uniref:Class I adenylate-forming enzyme family protein n=1 Tax=Actinomadura rugatobispora TaxID=1994 RepID=A0ABW0ZV62_9ACTN|nr:long-chain fatty acid--CoA ligase [Actinomadura rugatobispora]